MELDEALALIRRVPDFPEPGVVFQDITPVLGTADAFKAVVDAMAQTLTDVDAIVAIDARGFFFGAAVAYSRGLGVVPVRKAGKLPVVGGKAAYSLEYGTAELEIPAGMIEPGQRVVVIDDVLATGGTAAAACELVELAEAEVAGITVLLEIGALGGRGRLAGRKLDTLLTV
ncbi:adenine phosphoribosyltransferase [Kibdelosporangium phytohabitans]|uniref:Adenine phosphoribosyltransferase n=1 Tax=Kibdelosporangium phytohabitans TaxID=860235 RepID=A0A0N7F4L0_9PSEU|nr:adenine phosphoribosyltransferase [Kibdelosporangium phytohabitans]ALG11727.1 adenine phosphoribosyltransferase [Kibdelosporangium phytohabitans]MBE1463128.1 adenine phosphoribosyltransferase [Kibdelosporangium phytohabitans]